MKKLICAALVATSITSLAEARSYFGFRFGYPELGLQLGSQSLLSRNFGGRLTAEFGYDRSTLLIGGDLIYTFFLPQPAGLGIDIYLGAGIGAGFRTNSSGASYNVHGLAGANFWFGPFFGVFAEVRPFGYGNDSFYVGGSLGFNLSI